MGYITQFELDVTGFSEDALAEFEEAADNHEETPCGIHYSDFVNGETISCKWYNSKEDMIDLSKKFPELLFSVDAAGEEPGDLWRAWARNGKYKRIEPEMVWPKIDLNRELPAGVASDEKKAERNRSNEIAEQISALQEELSAIKRRNIV